MTLWRPAFLLTWRAIRQLPRLPAVLVFSLVPSIVQLLLFGTIFASVTKFPEFPTDNYYEYLAPGVAFFTAMIGVANAGVALATDFQTGYFNKILLAPVNMWSILLGRLLGDGVRVYLQAGIILLLSLLFGAKVATGVPGALLMLALAVLFSLFSVGVLMANVALKTKDAQSVQAVFPIFFILTFLTTSFIYIDSIDSEIMRSIIKWNPAQFIVEPMQSLMLYSDYRWDEIGIAFAVIGGFIVLGVLLTRANYRNVYK